MGKHKHHKKEEKCVKPLPPPPVPVVVNVINECNQEKKKCQWSNITPPPVNMTINFANIDTNYVNAIFDPLSIFGSNPPTNPINCWCGQFDVSIPVSVPFNTVLVSSYDPKLLAVFGFYEVPMIQYNIRKVNYLVNRIAYYETTLPCTYKEIQTAIWRLLDDPNYIPPSFDPHLDYTQVNLIVNDANTNGVNYIPTQPTDYCVIFCIPLTPSGILRLNPYQVMVLPVQLQNLINSPFQIC